MATTAPPPVDVFTSFLQLPKYSTQIRDALKRLQQASSFSSLTTTSSISSRTPRVILRIDELAQHPDTGNRALLYNPTEFIPVIEDAMRKITDTVAEDFPKLAQEGRTAKIQVGFDGPFGNNSVTPRTLQARLLGQLISVEGIVTRCSLVRPKIRRSVHYCPATGLYHAKEYRDATMMGIPSQSTTYPQEDGDGNPLVTEYGYCHYEDHQTITIQEMPEAAPPGQIPRSVEIILDDDLVDKAKPGDRISVVGVYRSHGGMSGGSSGIFRTLLIANNVRQLSKSINARATKTEISQIRNLAKTRKAKVFKTLANSLAPSIWGHDYVKKAILLLLLGGSEKNLANGTHIRGDINILMVGDPSTAKSQLLRFVLNAAPLAIATTGRGSSGVGLTAAVTSDKETGERRLEAGAMVLADRGIVCIDEFDKMSDDDRVAIHEVMEQQTVTIAKAGIHTSLNARCSVLAASNPIYGHLVRELSLHKQIALPDSLLSRFDIIFAIRDETDMERDGQLSMHVLRMHQYIPQGLEKGQPIPEQPLKIYAPDEPDAQDADKSIYEKFNPLIHGAERRQATKDVLRLDFLKKYISYAKNNVKPTLTSEASQLIGDVYSELRQRGAVEGESDRNALPVTPRLLETLIRLATGHAKARLSVTIEKIDVEAVNEILEYAFNQDEAIKKKREKEEKRKKRRLAKGSARLNGFDTSEEEDSDEEYTSARPSARSTPHRSQKKSITTSTVAPSSPAPASKAAAADDISPAIDDETVDPARASTFKTLLQRLRAEGRIDETIEIAELVTMINTACDASTDLFNQPEIETYLEEVKNDTGSLQVDGDSVWFI